MTQYRLKKDTFGIPAGTVAEKGVRGYILRCGVGADDVAFNDLALPNCLVENCDEFEKVEEPKKWARAAYIFESGRIVNPPTLVSSLSEAVSNGESYSGAVAQVIWPARFDDEGYLIMEVEG